MAYMFRCRHFWSFIHRGLWSFVHRAFVYAFPTTAGFRTFMLTTRGSRSCARSCTRSRARSCSWSSTGPCLHFMFYIGTWNEPRKAKLKVSFVTFCETIDVQCALVDWRIFTCVDMCHHLTLSNHALKTHQIFKRLIQTYYTWFIKCILKIFFVFFLIVCCSKTNWLCNHPPRTSETLEFTGKYLSRTILIKPLAENVISVFMHIVQGTR